MSDSTTATTETEAEARAVTLALAVRDAHAVHAAASEAERRARVVLQEAAKVTGRASSDLNTARGELDTALRALATGDAS